MESSGYTAAFVYQVIFVIALLLLALALCIKRMITERRKRIAAEEQLKQMDFKVQALEVDGMKHKLNPHLFKNVLNSIQSHAYQTYHAMDKLAEVLDYILYESDQQYVSVEKELQFAGSLIEINKVKVSPLFDLRIKVKSDEDPLVQEPLVIPMVSAAIIENAFKHADLQSADAFIAINMGCKAGIFTVHVANKISKKSPLRKEHSGLGDESLQKRLAVIYGDCYSLEKTARDGTYAVTLKIDLLGYKNKMHHR